MYRLFLAACCAIVCAAVPEARAAESARVIVKLRGDSPLVGAKSASDKETRDVRAAGLAQRTGLSVRAGPALAERAQVVVATGLSSRALALRLAQEADVEYAVPDERRYIVAIPNDALYLTGAPVKGPAAGQWYLRPPSAIAPAAVDAESAWDITVGAPGIVVADVDTGVRFEHPDLLSVGAGGNLLPGYDMLSDVGMANDGDGRDPDASDPGDWITDAELADVDSQFHGCGPSAHNSSWHGTKVAGIIAALTNNGIGMASIGRTVRLLPVRALGKCGGFDSDIIAGMRWAAGLTVPGVPPNATPARVINLSLGAPGICTSAYTQAIDEITAAGTIIVAAAGNSSGHAVGVPANCPGVIAVAGLRHAGMKVGFSDLGAPIAIAAPAGNCVNTAPGTACLYPILTASDTGTTTAVGPTYTDSFTPSFGTSFAAPLVAGTVALMLSTRPNLTPAQVRQIVQATARLFPTTGGDNGDGTIVPVCTAPQTNTAGNPVDQLQCYCTTSTCGAGMLDARAAVLAASTGVAVSAAQYEGIWWNAAESGWGLNVAQQGNVIFVTWFTYDANGRPWWLSMTATATGTGPYTGTLLATHGPAFNAMPFLPSQVTSTSVGSATLTFQDASRGTFAYTVNGVSRSKAIARMEFGPVPSCTSGLLADPAGATNVQDLWWAAPAGVEAGWGINLVQQGSTVFATWFTYDVDGAPLWLAVTAPATGSATYSGTLYRTTGPAFSALTFDPAQVVATPVGTATFTLTNGNAARFDYTVNGVAQSKAITREIFSGTGTTCR